MNCVVTATTTTTQNNNALATPEPHYIPGYAGYVPQEKYRPGHTYGMTSHRVLLDPCIHMSPRSILNNIHPENCTDQFGRPGVGLDGFGSSQMALVNTRVNSFGRQQYQPNMTPGYTGFIPRGQTILGHTFSPACNRALARFEQDQWRDRLFTKELEAMDGWRHCYKTKPWENSQQSSCPGNGDQCLTQDYCRGCQQQQQPSNMVQPPCPGASAPVRVGGGCGGCAGRY